MNNPATGQTIFNRRRAVQRALSGHWAGRLLRGELVTAPRLKNPAISKRLNDIILQAMAPDVARRYQRASDLLHDVLELRKPHTPRPPEAEVSRVAARPATAAEGAAR